ncbi:thioesterase family protein [Halobacillus sp. ACCC02827]|uniref:acyl-CoA thioesterase n=1 Tax=Bacillaceae TaxID=186817 RepID=UPI0002A51C7A|nr:MULTISPECIES: thioesterase family protein [Bacillaceae]ELK45895.1 hypothetical protein D479_12983 [Halobacillus sp. BAB-2008]QHT47750.1 acyl-CoA thioesterase [Bacillus sp. SB49]WJE14990.1 thioesterase family protein [Halobacillus sp. ACCC02827]
MEHESKVRVRFCETDMAGHVNNTSYFIYLEEARGKFFQDIFPSHLNTVGTFILATTTCDFVSQAYFGQPLIVQSWVSDIGNSSFSFGHRIIVEGTEELVAKASAVIVHFNYDKQISERIPDELRLLLDDCLMTERSGSRGKI